MQIGLLVAGHLPKEMQDVIGDYDAYYSRLLAPQGITLTPWNVVDMEFPPDVHAAPGWLISGSRHGAYEDLPFIAPLEEFIRDAHAGRVPMVGICFGHQIIAQALGGRVEKFEGGWGVGRHEYDWGDRKLALNVWHQDQIVEKPEEARVLASSPFCPYAALAYGDTMLTTQAHPEFDADAVELLLKHRAPGLVPEDRIATASESLAMPTNDADLSQMIGDFFRRTVHDELA